MNSVVTPGHRGAGGRQHSQKSLLHQQCLKSAMVIDNQFPGFHLSTGFLAAAVSSSLDTRVECGAACTICGSSSTSSAIDFMASMNRSISSFDSLSVGSIIMAPGTISGKAVV